MMDKLRADLRNGAKGLKLHPVIQNVILLDPRTREAVELFKTHQPHLVLMDINMPVLNGYEATAEIRKLSERVPIIAVTAYAYASDEERIMNSGFDAYVPKPLNASIMRSKIVELLKKRLVFI